jgi:hypothetical protein
MSVEMGSNDGRIDTERETVAAVDDIDGRPHLVVADVTRDDAWIAVGVEESATLEEWA